MANQRFYEQGTLESIFYTPSTSSTALAPLQPPLFHHQEDDDEYFNNIPTGFAFVPTDEELILDYLKRKLQNLPLPRNKIAEVNLYDHHPQRLAEKYKKNYQKNYLYFFTPRDRKYKNGTRPNRAASGGYWKASGADKAVIHEGRVVGLRKSLVYYAGKPPNGEKSNWLMQEFRMKDSPKPRNRTNDMKLDDWVLCRINELNHRRGGAAKTRPFQEDDDSSCNYLMETKTDHFSPPDTCNAACPDSFPTSFAPSSDFGYNVEEVSNLLGTQQFGSFDDVLSTGSFDDIHHSSFMSLPPLDFPPIDLPPFPDSLDFNGNFPAFDLLPPDPDQFSKDSQCSMSTKD